MSLELSIRPGSLPAADGVGKAVGSGDVASHMPALALRYAASQTMSTPACSMPQP